MKYVMGLASIAWFFGGLMSIAFLKSDIQLIIVEVALLGGFLLAGMAAVLNAVGPTVQPARAAAVPSRPKKPGLRGVEERLLGPRDSERLTRG